MGWGPHPERTGVGGPLAMKQHRRYKNQHIVFVEECFYAIRIFSIQKAKNHLVVFHQSLSKYFLKP